MYFIYYIPNFVNPCGTIGKIGVSEEPENRVRKQGYTQYEILETHDDIYEVSKREMELQKEWGLPVDAKPYYMVRKIPTKEGIRKGGKKSVESGHIKKMCKIAAESNIKRKMDRMKSILDTIPTKQFITKDIREACDKFDVYDGYWMRVVKEKSLVKQIHKGNNQFNPSIYEKVY